MCGIAGAVGFVDDEVRQGVLRMQSSLRHRGPDSAGIWIRSGETCPEASVVLAHRRLAIIDLTDDGRQPMVDDETGCVIIYNGEIYNFEEIREELEAQGVSVRSRSDTEVFLRAYIRWGRDCVERFRGMFAAAIWDPRSEEVTLIRDRLGIKPLYYFERLDGDSRRTVLFSSEVRGLLASGLVAPRLNPSAVESYLWNGFVNGPESIINGVRELPPGHIATVGQRGDVSQAGAFWNLPHGSRGEYTPRDAIDRLEHELAESVRLRLVSDVPLGIFLSGGIDSSAVAALAVKSASREISTFNISFDETEYSEAKYAQKVAKQLGTTHHEIQLSEGEFHESLACALGSLDQPTFDGINTYFVSRAVRAAGLTVALAGTGGDELFGGYRSFVDIPRARRMGRWLSWAPDNGLRSAARLITQILHGRHGSLPSQTRWGKLGDVLCCGGDIVKLYQVFYSLFTSEFHESLLLCEDRSRNAPRTIYGLSVDRYRELTATTEGTGDLDGVSLLELSCFICNRLLRDTDMASMGVSLEARVPLLDHRVVEAAVNVDTTTRMRPIGRKRLLRELALASVDDDLFERGKSGFVLPINTWLQRGLRETVGAVLTDEVLCRQIGVSPDAARQLWAAFQSGGRGMYWSRPWALFVLMWWCRRYGVSI